MTNLVSMRSVSVSELKAQLSRYLREVQRGGEVQVLDRGVPVARLVAAAPASEDEDKARRTRLIQAGALRPRSAEASAALGIPPLKLAVSLRDAVEEERDDRQ